MVGRDISLRENRAIASSHCLKLKYPRPRHNESISRRLLEEEKRRKEKSDRKGSHIRMLFFARESFYKKRSDSNNYNSRDERVKKNHDEWNVMPVTCGICILEPPYEEVSNQANREPVKALSGVKEGHHYIFDTVLPK